MSLNGKGFRIVGINIRSLLKHLSELTIAFSGVDVICVVETWLSDIVNNDTIAIPGYHIFRQDRNILVENSYKKRGGGIVIYVRNNIASYCNIMKESNCDVSLEQLWVKIQKPNMKKMVIGAIYRPPSSGVTAGMDMLNNTCRDIMGGKRDTKNDIVIVGDFNIDFNKSSPDKQRLKDFEKKFYLKQLIKTPTRITNKSKTVIDLIFTNVKSVKNSGVLSNIMSDHLPVFLIKKHTRIKNTTSWIETRCYKSYDAKKVVEKVEGDWRWNEFWHVVNDPNKLWDIIVVILTAACDLLYPIKKRKRWNNGCEWVDTELINTIEKKNRLYKKACKTNMDTDWAQYKTYRKKATTLLRQKRRGYIMLKLKGCKTDPKGFWREVGRNLNIGKRKAGPKCEKVRNCDNVIVSDKEAADAMNNYYINMGPTLAKTFLHTWEPNEYLNSLKFRLPYKKRFSFSFVSENVIRSILKALPINKSSGVGNISSRFIRDSLLCMITETTHLINECLRLELMPDKWKVGIITPLPKSKVSVDPGDWRPVSVLPLPSKIIERAVYMQLVRHFEENGLLFPNQHGFRKELSTSTAIFEYVQFLYNSHDSQECTNSIFVDYSRAFDTIDHFILCRKLKLYGLDMNSLGWFQNYLSERQQMVKIGDYKSEPLLVQMGVPQDLMSAVCKTQLALDCLSEWCKINRLSINIKKTKTMSIVNRSDLTKDKSCPTTKLNGIQLEEVDKYNYLGVIVDNKLSFADFMDDKYNKVNARIYQLKQLRPYVSEDIACRVYKQTIVPLLDYADFMIESSAVMKHNRLEGLQEKAIKYINNGNIVYNNIDDIYVRYNVQPLKLRWREHMLCVAYRQSRMKHMVDTNRPNIVLRSHDRIKFKTIGKRHYELYLKSPLSRCIKVWNTVCKEVQRATSKVKFKKLIRPMCMLRTGR